MSDKFENLIKEIINKGIPIVGTTIVGDSLAFEVNGFSKSGTALVYEEGDTMYSKTRYNTIDEISDFRDLAYVAFKWNDGYINRQPFTAYDSNWKPYFEEYEWI